MKLLIEFLPIVIFFIAYKAFDIYIATMAAIAVATIQVLFDRLYLRKWDRNHLLTFAIICFFGGATLLLQDEVYIKWKPTVINGIFAIAFLVSQFVGRQSLVERLLGTQIKLSRQHWGKLNMSWVAFFAFCGLINVYVMYAFDTDTWVNFKLFGMLGLTILFMFGQSLMIARMRQNEGLAESERGPTG